MLGVLHLEETDMRHNPIDSNPFIIPKKRLRKIRKAFDKIYIFIQGHVYTVYVYTSIQQGYLSIR